RYVPPGTLPTTKLPSTFLPAKIQVEAVIRPGVGLESAHDMSVGSSVVEMLTVAPTVAINPPAVAVAHRTDPNNFTRTIETTNAERTTETQPKATMLLVYNFLASRR